VVLVDTSIWIEVFRARDPLDLDGWLDHEEIVTCLPVIQEVLQGFREESAYRTAREALFAFPVLESPMTAEVFDEAASLYRLARRSGLTVRSGTDCLIATCAIRNQVAVLHQDRDYDVLASVSHLQVEHLAP